MAIGFVEKTNKIIFRLISTLQKILGYYKSLPRFIVSILVTKYEFLPYTKTGTSVSRSSIYYLPQHFLYFLPLPHGHGALRPMSNTFTF